MSKSNLKRSLNQINSNDLFAKFKSKHDIYLYLTEQLQFYLPPQSQLNKEFFKELFKGNKKLFKIADVKYIIVPKLDELSVNNMIELVKDDKLLKQYLPDEFLSKKVPDRKFFFNILNTLHPGYLGKLISHASQQRIGLNQKDQEKQTILATDEWVQNLSAVPFYSKKNGRTLHLLKQCSKPVPNERKRRKFEAAGSLTEFKVSQNLENQQISNIISSNQNANQNETMKNENTTTNKPKK